MVGAASQICWNGLRGVRSLRSSSSPYPQYLRSLEALNVVMRLKICARFFLTANRLGNNIELSLRKEVVQEHE